LKSEDTYWESLHLRVSQRVKAKRKRKKIYLTGISIIVVMIGLWGMYSTLSLHPTNTYSTDSAYTSLSGPVFTEVTIDESDWLFSPLEDDWFEYL